jgi:Uma2 family endonuclease
MRAVIADFPKHWLEERKRSGSHRFDEFWDGVLHVPPYRTTSQQALLADLSSYLEHHWARPRRCKAHHGVNITMPKDEANWLHNFRIADIVLLTPDRFHIDKNEYMVGAPLVVVEIASPADETYDKFPFYAGLGIPEMWVIHRDTRTPEIHLLGSERKYTPAKVDASGWLRSPATGVEFRQTRPGKVWARINGDESIAAELPEE